jgi:hypothetical protein
MLISDFHAAAESRGDGLHPKLRALIQIYQAAEITRRLDGMLQAGPSPASEASFQEKAMRSDPYLSPTREALPRTIVLQADASGTTAIV